jgi:5-methylcytosine-specific restriction enzyme subunit McrC
MSNDIQLGEYRECEVILPDEDVETLHRFFPKEFTLRPTGEAKRYLLKAGSHVGVVVLPSGRTLVVEPKVKIETLFALLAAVYDPNREFFRDEEHHYSTVETLFEFVVHIFATHVEDLITRGIMRGYQPFTSDMTAIRGRLEFAETLRHRPAIHDRHWCTYSRFTPDVIENRILRWTAFSLRAYHYKDQRLPGRLRRIVHLFSDVTLDQEARHLFQHLSFHRLNDPYQPALNLARLLLSHLSFSGVSGREPFMAYLVDMNWLFEKYVSAVLTNAAGIWEIELHAQSRHALDTKGDVTVIPDIILFDHDVPLLIIDAKYKLAPNKADIYQMLAYCHALGVEEAILVHPLSEHIQEDVVTIRKPGRIRVHYMSLNLDGGPEELEEHNQEFVERVGMMLSLLTE